MSQPHENHAHIHGVNCGHIAVQHGNHVDFLHDGHLHHQTTAGFVEEHTLDVNDTNPASCTSGHDCSGHDAAHVHGPNCGHEAVPHGDHIDYLVDDHLHHQHNGHCDNHGVVTLRTSSPS